MELKIPLKKQDENNRNYIYNVLKENIINMNLKPGILISETDLTKTFGVSRTPIREAFIRLKEDNLIDIYPQKGSFISLIDLKLVEEGFFMRKSLETSVLLRAIQSFPKESIDKLKEILAFQKALVELDGDPSTLFKLDNQFHETIFKSCGYNKIWSSLESVCTHHNRFRLLDTSLQSSNENTIKQHQKIIKIIEDKNSSCIDEVVNNHLTNILDKSSKLQAKFPDYFINN